MIRESVRAVEIPIPEDLKALQKLASGASEAFDTLQRDRGWNRVQWSSEEDLFRGYQKATLPLVIMKLIERIAKAEQQIQGKQSELDAVIESNQIIKRDLEQQITTLEAQVKLLSAPVGDEEWKVIPKLMAGKSNYSSRDEVDTLIKYRAGA